MDIQAFKTMNSGVLTITDDLGPHREAISVPLEMEGEGSITQPTPEKLKIRGPAADGVAAFLESLPSRLRALDLSRIPRFEE